jgi:hypothetical protein
MRYEEFRPKEMAESRQDYVAPFIVQDELGVVPVDRSSHVSAAHH